MAIFLALTTCFVLVPLGAFVVDIGMQRVGRSDAQAMADTSAMDMGRLLASGGVPTDALAKAAAQRSAGAVGDSLTVSVHLGTINSANFASAQAPVGQGRGCGSTTYDSYFSSASAGDATAVLVVVKTRVGYSIHTGSGWVCRSALAKAAPIACFKLGSYAAAVHSGDSTVLGPLLGALGSGIDTSVLSYQGLANTQLSLQGLATSLSAGSPTELLGTTVTLNNFYVAVVDALRAQGDTADANVLDALRVHLSAISAATPVKVSDLLSLTSTDNSALTGTVNALDLVTGAATIADGTSFISVPGLNVNLAGITQATTKLKVVEPPKIGCGRPNSSTATADTAQTQLDITASVLGGLPKVLGLGVSAGPIDIQVDAAQAHGQLTGVDCSSTPKSMTVAVTPSLLPATITIPITVSAPLLGSLNLTAVVTTVPTSPSSTTVTLKVPDNLYTPVSTGTGNLNVNSTNATITANGSTGLLGLLGITLSALINALNTSIVSTLESTLITPLLNSVSALLQTALGTSLAGADAFAESISCANPALAG